MDFGHSAPNHVAQLLNKREANIRNSMKCTQLDSCEVFVVRTVLSSLRASWTPKTPLQDFNLQDVPTTFQFTLHGPSHCVSKSYEPSSSPADSDLSRSQGLWRKTPPHVLLKDIPDIPTGVDLSMTLPCDRHVLRPLPCTCSHMRHFQPRPRFHDEFASQGQPGLERFYQPGPSRPRASTPIVHMLFKSL